MSCERSRGVSAVPGVGVPLTLSVMPDPSRARSSVHSIVEFDGVVNRFEHHEPSIDQDGAAFAIGI